VTQIRIQNETLGMKTGTIRVFFVFVFVVKNTVSDTMVFAHRVYMLQQMV